MITGLLMGKVALVASVLLVFPLLAKDGPHRGVGRLLYLPMAWLGLAVALPLGGSLVGGGMGVLYRLARLYLPGQGWGSPNAFFTLSVAGAAFLLALPFLPVLASRKGMCGALMFGTIFAGLFGWLMPWLAR